MENRAEFGKAASERGEAQRRLRALTHDMCVPLKNVIALAQMSLEGLGAQARAGESAVEENLRKILAAAKDLELLTQDVFAEGGTPAQRFTAQELALSVSAAVSERAREKRQLLHMDTSGLGMHTYQGDRTALLRIVNNLMSNAVKYTQEGGRISFRAAIAARTQEGVEAEFIVEDNGMGMDEAFLERMYQPFERSEQAVKRGIPGYGLGLATVWQMAQRMNGRLEVTSRPGKGTRFVLRAQLRLAAGRGNAAELKGRRFLLAEDNDLSAEIAAQLLRQKGASVRRAENGTQAVKLFFSLPAGTFDAILLDMRMPVMGGCGAAAEIRMNAREDAGRIPILALTAGGDAQDERLALAAGMDACLQKPLDTARLQEEMGRIAGA